MLVAGGLLGLGAISDFVSKPVMTGFLFGLGLTIMAAQLDSLTGDNAITIVFGGTCVVVLLAFKLKRPGWPAMLILSTEAVGVSRALAAQDHYEVDTSRALAPTRRLIVTAVLSLGLVVKRLSRPRVAVRDGVVMPHAPLFYANAHAVLEVVRAQPGPVTLDLEHSFDLDVESVDMLAELGVPLVNVHPQAEEMLSRRGSAGLVRRRSADPR